MLLYDVFTLDYLRFARFLCWLSWGDWRPVESSYKCHARHRLLQEKKWCQPQKYLSSVLFASFLLNSGPGGNAERCVCFCVWCHIPTSSCLSNGWEICKARTDVTWLHSGDTRTETPIYLLWDLSFCSSSGNEEHFRVFKTPTFALHHPRTL